MLPRIITHVMFAFLASINIGSALRIHWYNMTYKYISRRKLLMQLTDKTANLLFAIGRCTGRFACSSHRKDPLFYLFASPAKLMLMSIRIVEFQPQKGASFVAEHLSLSLCSTVIIIKITSALVRKDNQIFISENQRWMLFCFLSWKIRSKISREDLIRELMIVSIGKI